MKHFHFFAFFVAIILCNNCSGNKDSIKKLDAELRQFKAKAITLPTNLLAKNCEEQVLPDSTLLLRPLKMVVYINQDGCQSCKLRSLLPIYMYILENQYRENFGVVIILNTQEIEVAEFTLKEIGFCKTVFFDPDACFERLNPHLPANEQLHTFLLNNNNKVILVGNPVHNERLNDLYIKEMNKK